MTSGILHSERWGQANSGHPPWASHGQALFRSKEPPSLSEVNIDRLQFLAAGGSSVWRGGDRTLEAVEVAEGK